MKTSYPQCVVTTVSRAISLVTLGVVGLSGCGLNITNPALFNGASTGTVNPVTPVTPATPVVEGTASIPLKGYVGGEQWSVSGASVQLYAMGTQGSGSPATALLSQPVVTDNNGNFVIDQSYACPSSSSQLYLAATGGTTGQVSGSSNQAIRLITLIGPCSGVSATAIYPVNEVTTIGAIWPLKAYIASITQFGMSNTDSQFASAETMVSELVNLQNATSPGSGVPDGYAVQSQKLNTIADDLHACVVTTGGSAGDGTACGQLFSLTSAPGAASPMDTFQAALQLAQSPQQNAAGLLQLGSSSTAFQPVLLDPPADWNLELVQITAAPLIQPAAGTYPAGQQITMSASSTSAEIHYTLDGSTPTESSSVYEGPLVLTTAETVKAAVIAKEISGQVASSSYSITAPHLVFTAQPSSINSGAAFSPVVTISVVDSSGKLMQSSIPVSLTLMGGGGSSNLNGVTSVTAASGVASFSGLSVSGSGDGYSLLASSPGVASVGSGIFSVTASQTQTASLAFSLPNGSVNVGDSMAGTLTLSKAAAAGGVKVQVSASPQTTLSITPSTVIIPAGQTTGSLVLTGLAQGTAILTASSAGAVSGTAQMIVNPAPDKATHLVFTTQPSNLASGAVFSPTVSVSTVDDSGKVVSSSALITLSLNGANGSLSGQASSAARNGVANFPGLGESVAGDGYTLTATSPSLISATSSGFNVAAAVPEVPQISLAVPSQSIHIGDTLTGKIMLSKPAGVDGIRVQVSTTSPNIVSVTPVSVIIGAGQTAGVISCNGLSAGSTTLVASATGSNIASATVTVMAATPSIPHLVFTTQPTDTAAGATLAPAPTISIVDDSGNLVSSSNAQVTLTLASSNDSTASLTGTSTLNASNGVAVFSTLSVASIGSGYTLTATSTGAGSIVSNSFNVTPAVSASLIPASATISSNLEAHSNWQWNHDPGTPGSSSGTSSYGVSSPSINGASRIFALNYSAHGGEIYHLSFGLDPNATHFVYESYIYIADPTQIQNIEMDMNHVMANGQTVILGTQCANGSKSWEFTKVANGGTHWYASNIPCDPRSWTANSWHHVQIASHHDSKGTATYDWVSVDGTVTNFQNATGPSALSLGWQLGDLLINFQLDGYNKTSGAITVYTNKMAMYRW